MPVYNALDALQRALGKALMPGDGSTRQRSFLLSLLVGLGVFAIFSLNAEYLLLQVDPYQRVLERQGYFDRAPQLIARQITNWLPLTDESRLHTSGRLSFLSRSELEALLSPIFPQLWVKEQTLTLLTELIDYINLEKPKLELNLSLQPVKEQLEGEAGQQVGQAILASWPDCTLEQAVDAARQLLRGETQDLPICRPPEMVLSLVQPLVGQAISSLSESLPDRIALADSLPLQIWLVRTDHTAPRWLVAARWGMRLSPVFVIGLLGLLTLQASPGGWSSLTNTWTQFLIRLGLGTLGVALISWVAVGAFLAESGLASPETLLAAISSAILEVWHNHLFVVGIEGLVLASVGLGVKIMYAWIVEMNTY